MSDFIKLLIYELKAADGTKNSSMMIHKVLLKTKQ